MTTDRTTHYARQYYRLRQAASTKKERTEQGGMAETALCGRCARKRDAEVCVRSLFGLPEPGSRRPRIKVETATTGS